MSGFDGKTIIYEDADDIPTRTAESEYFVPVRVSEIQNRWFQHLSGKIMTVIESAIPDGPQCKATKDIACQMIWQVYNEMWDELSRKSTIPEIAK